LKRVLTSDAYKPHTHDELTELVAPEVAAGLDPDKEYGIRWHNKYKISEYTVSEPDGNGGRRYKKRSTTTLRPREEWVAVPVPARLPGYLVERARAAMPANKGSDRKHLAREWELRGLMRCSCGSRMGTHTVRPRARPYHYYSCSRRRELRKMCDCGQPSIPAREVEPVVWEFVSRLLGDPGLLRRGLEEMIALEREDTKGDPERETKAWAEKLAEADRKRSRYQEMAAEGLITLDELRAKLAGIREAREAAQRQLATSRGRKERSEELEMDRVALLESLADKVTAGLEALSGAERNNAYRTLRLLVTPAAEGYEVGGTLCTIGPWSLS
jgi:site-specific DNA recombinase